MALFQSLLAKSQDHRVDLGQMPWFFVLARALNLLVLETPLTSLAQQNLSAAILIHTHWRVETGSPCILLDKPVGKRAYLSYY